MTFHLYLGSPFIYSGGRYITGKLSKRRVIQARLLYNPFRFPPLNTWKTKQKTIYPVFPVFNGENWNGLDSDLVYATRHFETLSEIYRSPLYMKAFASYKVTTKQWKMEHFGFSLIYQKCFHLQRRSIYPRKGLGTAGGMD